MAKQSVDEPQCAAHEHEQGEQEWHVLHAFGPDHQSLRTEQEA